MSSFSIERLVADAWADAVKHGESDNNLRSACWVEAIAAQLRPLFPEPRYRVFSKGYEGNQRAFRRNEFLFDVTLVEIATVNSPNGKTLEYPKRVLFHVESEFHSSNSRESIIDLSKLLMSSATDRLLVLPQGGKIEEWAHNVLTKIEKTGGGSLCIAFVPHPREWEEFAAHTPSVIEVWAR